MAHRAAPPSDPPTLRRPAGGCPRLLLWLGRSRGPRLATARLPRRPAPRSRRAPRRRRGSLELLAPRGWGREARRRLAAPAGGMCGARSPPSIPTGVGRGLAREEGRWWSATSCAAAPCTPPARPRNVHARRRALRGGSRARWHRAAVAACPTRSPAARASTARGSPPRTAARAAPLPSRCAGRTLSRLGDGRAPEVPREGACCGGPAGRWRDALSVPWPQTPAPRGHLDRWTAGSAQRTEGTRPPAPRRAWSILSVPARAARRRRDEVVLRFVPLPPARRWYRPSSRAQRRGPAPRRAIEEGSSLTWAPPSSPRDASASRRARAAGRWPRTSPRTPPSCPRSPPRRSPRCVRPDLRGARLNSWRSRTNHNP